MEVSVTFLAEGLSGPELEVDRSLPCRAEVSDLYIFVFIVFGVLTAVKTTQFMAFDTYFCGPKQGFEGS
jgi:hypothetical protein